VGAPAAPPPLGVPRPAGGPPPMLGGNAPPPLGAMPGLAGAGPLSPPPLSPLGGLGASPLSPLGGLGAPPSVGGLGGAPLGPGNAPPILRAPSLPGVQPPLGNAPPAMAPPPLASNASPLAPVAPVGGAAVGSPGGPIFGPMPPLPNAAPPPVAAPPIAPAPAMPPMSPYGAPPMVGGLNPLGPPPPMGPLAPVAEAAPNNPSPLLGLMPALPPAPPPMAPIPALPHGPPPDPYGGINNDPFAGVGGGGGDPFASSPQPASDPYAMAGGQYPSPAGSNDPFAGAGTQNPFQRGQRGPTALPGTALGPAMPAPMRSRQGTGLPHAWQDPLAPALEQPTETRPRLGRARMLVTQLDGTEQGEVPLIDGENLIGREVGGIYAEDNLLSSRHATIIVQGGSAWVRDEGSRNGVYVRIPRQTPVELRDGDQFCFGRIILRFEQRPPTNVASPGDFAGMLSLVVGRDVDRNLFPYPVSLQGLTIGRTRADLRFPSDGWVSGSHCQITVIGPQVMLTDVGSSNGTFMRIRGTRPLQHTDALLMGQRIFHVQLQ